MARTWQESRRYLATLATIGAVTALATGCGSSGSSGGSTSAPSGTATTPATTSNGAPAQTIKLGVINSLTGPAAFVGIPGQAAMKVAAALVNSDPTTYLGGAGRSLDLTYKDGGTTTPQALTEARDYAAQSSTLGIIGPTITQQGYALTPFAQSSKIPELIPYSNGETQFTKPGAYDFSQSQPVPHVVTAAINATLQKHSDIKKAAVIWGSDNGGNVAVGALATSELKAKGITVTADPVTFETLDFTAAIAKAKSAGAQAIYLGTGGPADAAAMQQANRVGYHPVWIGYETMDDPSVTANGGSEANGAIMAADYNPALNTPQNVAFKKAYTAATKQQPSNYAALGYQSIINIATAIKAIPGTVTRDNLAAALATIKATSIVSGGVPFQFASNRLAADPAAVITIANGKFVLLK